MQWHRTLQHFAVAVCIGAAITMSNAAITIDLVNVGHAGNAADPSTGSLYGAVSYDYAIGKYEVTIGQYTSFLNAVAVTDTYSVYNANMGTDTDVAGITRTGISGNFSYSVMTNSGSSANRPITYVSWFDAARFANWMANGQPTGTQGNATTENGAYALNGAMSGNVAITKNAVNPNTSTATVFWIPSKDEWYKAAYYSPGASTDSYWLYPTQSDSVPGNVIGSVANQANFYSGGYSTESAPYLTDVGTFSGSATFFGTFDQGGNVSEWNDGNGSSRGNFGGSWTSASGGRYLGSSGTTYDPETYEFGDIGFRIASVPEPTATVLVTLAGAAWLALKRRKIAL